eukprot:112595_1
MKSVCCKRHIHNKSLPLAQSLRNLCQLKANALSIEQKSDTVREALELYSNIDDKQKDYVIFNDLLRLCFNFGESHKALIFYNDIKQLSTHDKQFVSYSLLAKTCIETEELDKCMEVFAWITDSKYTLRIHEKFITKLIQQCDRNVQYLNYVFSLMTDHIIECKAPNIVKTALIYRFGKASCIDQALNVFHSIPDTEKDIVCILKILHACNANRHYHQTLILYQNMNSVKVRDTIQNEPMYHAHAIKACQKINDLRQGKLIHSSLREMKLLHTHFILSSALIDMYGYNGDIHTAKQTFDQVPDSKKYICLNHILNVLIEHGDNDAVLHIYDTYARKDDDAAHTTAVRACTNNKDYARGVRIIEHMSDDRYAQHIKWKNALINFYGKCGDITNAMEVFYSIKSETITHITIGSIMAVLIDNTRNQDALNVYDTCAVCRTPIIDILALKASILCKDSIRTKQIEDALLLQHNDNPEIMARLIDLYSYFVDVTGAEYVFNRISTSNAMCTVAMMKLYMSVDHNDKALQIYDPVDGYNDDFCHMLAIKACTKLNDFDRGKYIHQHINVLQHHIQLKNTLIDFYANSSDIAQAIQIFDSIPNDKKSIVTINAMMEAYCMNAMYTECLELFESLQSIYDTLKPDVITYSILFEACANATAYEFGTNVYESIKQSNDTQILKDTVVQTNLINMYGKCGMFDVCIALFEEIKHTQWETYRTEIAIWNAMMDTYGRNGDIDGMQRLLDLMKEDTDLKPNTKTYTIFISGCSHSGHVDQAMDLWQNDIKEDTIKYDPYMVSCLVDCLTRNGQINKAMDLVMQCEQIHTDPQLSLKVP